MTPSSHGRARATETFTALLIGAVLNALVVTVAHAQPLTIGQLADLSAVSGAAGGFVAALVHFSAIALTPPVEGQSRNVVAALTEGVFSVVVGGIAAHYLALPLATGLPWVPPSSAPVVGFGIGGFAWQTAPSFLAGVKLAASPRRIARAILQRIAGDTPEEQP